MGEVLVFAPSKSSTEADEDKATDKLATREIVAGTPFEERETSRTTPLVRPDPLLDDVAALPSDDAESSIIDNSFVFDFPDDQTACERPSRASIRRLALAPISLPLPAQREMLDQPMPGSEAVHSWALVFAVVLASIVVVLLVVLVART